MIMESVANKHLVRAARDLKVESMNGKPVLYRENSNTVLNLGSEGFREKLLCDGVTMNLGDACAYSCSFCYVETQARKFAKATIDAFNAQNGLTCDKPLGFTDVVIRRPDALQLLRKQLLLPNGSPMFTDPTDTRVVYSSTLVDVAANMTLLKETADACNIIFEHTNWQIRLLSKSSLLMNLVEKSLIPKRYHNRLILGFSTGTLDDKLARAFEKSTALVSKRLASLHWLQERGIRTFGMICPSLPQTDYVRFSRDICEAICVERCEHVWAEVVNLRGESLTRTLDALEAAGLMDDAERLRSVSGHANSENWEDYARATFEAHARNVGPEKLRFLQYINKDSATWWAERRELGAVLLGSVAKKLDLLVIPSPASITPDDRKYMEERESIITLAVRHSLDAARALNEIFTYEGGRLWRREFPSFEAYCRARWDYAKSHAYRLRDCGEFLSDLQLQSPNGEWMPVNEGQVRPVLGLPKEERVGCWKEIASETHPSKLTGKVVASLVRKRNPRPPQPDRATQKSERFEGARHDAEKALVKLRRAVTELEAADEALELLDRLKKLLRL